MGGFAGLMGCWRQHTNVERNLLSQPRWEKSSACVSIPSPHIMHIHLKKGTFTPNQLFALILRTELSQAFPLPLGAIEAENICNL